jgi:hypothetical protein
VEVEPDQAPMLTERPISLPNMLQLELEVGDSADPDFKGKVWKQALFHKEVSANQYNSVRVRWQDFIAANFPIHDDQEHAANAAGAMKALNAQQAGKGKAAKPYGKKPAAKKAAAKKAAPKKKSAAKKKAAGALRSKTAKKKAPKKVAKKAAKKKTAKKSAFKKMVRSLVKKFTPAKKKKRR